MKYIEVVFNIPLDRSFTYSCKSEADVLTGRRIVADFGRRQMTGMVISECNEVPDVDFEIKEIRKTVDEKPLFGEGEIALAGWISEMYQCSIGEALSLMLPGGKKESSEPAVIFNDDEDLKNHELDEQQIKAIDNFFKSDTRDFYLWGITGSGKTEVYLSIAEKILGQDYGVIYLVPEISLTHQLVREVARRFMGNIAVIHSAITPSQKLAEWKRIKSGNARFVIGARSAVFAPLENPGLFIIDEEHDGSYKSGSTPRYNARQVAMKRAAMFDARCIFGSATPSLETYNLIKNKRIAFSEMNKRLSGGHLPEIGIIDMRKEKKSISKELSREIKTTVQNGKQVILFLNRRGFSYFFHCRTCSYEMKCRQCSVSLTYHKESNRMVCHYCGFNQDPVQQCPECGSLDIGYSGFGTELIENEIRTIFPEFRSVRVDTDSVKKKGELQKILNDFRNRKYDILLGTQMVAKGLNFPGVQLVGIVNADNGLHLPDFRAQERVFSLISQVSGRCGRFMPDGKVIIQTFCPENEAIKYAAAGEIRKFYNKELEIRKVLNFPPYTRMARIVIRGKKKNEVRTTAADITSTIKNAVSGNTEIMGPSECAIAMISGNSRYQIIIKSDKLANVLNAVSCVREKIPKNSKCYIEYDIDPLNLL